MYVIGIDLGATNAKAAVVTKDGTVLKSIQEPLGDDLSPESVVKKIVYCAERALKELDMDWKRIEAVGIGSPGGIDSKRGVVIKSANLFPGCSDVPLCDMITRMTGIDRVMLVNDGDAAVMAEKWVGVGRKHEDLVFMTLGSGIGTGLIVNGRIVTGKTGTIEGGHHIIVAGGRTCTCGSQGCLEAYVSANSVVRRTKEALKDETSTISSSLYTKAKSSSLTCKDVFDAAQDGDDFAKKIVDDTAMFLAVGCINFFRILDTSVIVMSGGMMNAGSNFLKRVRYHIRNLNWTVLPVRDTVLEAEAG